MKLNKISMMILIRIQLLIITIKEIIFKSIIIILAQIITKNKKKEYEKIFKTKENSKILIGV